MEVKTYHVFSDHSSIPCVQNLASTHYRNRWRGIRKIHVMSHYLAISCAGGKSSMDGSVYLAWLHGVCISLLLDVQLRA
jgi:hypothetical protein